jgi:hypothetical protein
MAASAWRPSSPDVRTTGQRLDEHQAAIQRMLDWWGDLLPALRAMEDRLNDLAESVDDPTVKAELHGIRDLLAKASGDVVR